MGRASLESVISETAHFAANIILPVGVTCTPPAGANLHSSAGINKSGCVGCSFCLLPRAQLGSQLRGSRSQVGVGASLSVLCWPRSSASLSPPPPSSSSFSFLLWATRSLAALPSLSLDVFPISFLPAAVLTRNLVFVSLPRCRSAPWHCRLR